MTGQASTGSGHQLTAVLLGEIRQELTRQGMSLNEFARQTGISRKRVGRIFKASHPTEPELRRIARVVRLNWEPAGDEAGTDGT